ncbi:cellulase family glycosylhydrolase [Paracraurococcus lichenis]|uniref:Cellulase family glycosylhydrolase n=1 Tax=Paracraurococcus lichenis TaxID=3064888 RepID=A0ABT9E7V0_9PROT|nr:cellulase family glycosylhydrolase [Paracraurococcus sp. LOR1-02]MDO9712254.1 cellulase family glycosylhydrolase [Paracraurococcus sp. LOR1-02]
MDTFHVDGRYLLDTADNRVVLRGVNLPVLDNWGFPPDSRISEVEKTGANAVRLQWYVNYKGGDRPAYTLSDLDTLLDECRLNRLIPILMLADFTCAGDPKVVNSGLIPWWTDCNVVTVLNKHRKYLIIKLANEVGQYRWSPSPAAALASFQAEYKTAISAIRSHGLNMPVMIDAPDCGSSLEAFTNPGVGIGQDLIAHDPQRNVLLSVHAYWAAYGGMARLLGDPLAATLPLVFGEVANKQDEEVDATDAAGLPTRRTDFCFYDLDGTSERHPAPSGYSYQDLLTALGPRDIGWLAWSWWKDGCDRRQMTSTGNFTDLTLYGDDLVNNPTYGLRLGTFAAARTATLP